MQHGKYGNKQVFSGIYKGITVLVTGHTGFKGSWLCLWLEKMGANVVGYSLDAPTKPNHIDNLGLKITSIIGDIRDKNKLQDVFNKYQPEIVFHLAAQALVKFSYSNPVETFETNIMGSINVFETARKTSSMKAIVNITSDKVYENREWVWGYRENDSIGGYDPYSASKGAVELVASSYRNSFFNNDDYRVKHNILLASCRAGNVVGGGDWAEDRLIPDIIRAVQKNETVEIRSPLSVRPWQHVLEPLSGYLLVGKKLLEGKKEFAEAWNFGPEESGSMTVKDVLDNIKKYCPKIDYIIKEMNCEVHEAGLLKLDCSKAHNKLNWRGQWDSNMTFKKTINWYRDFYENKKINSLENLNDYINCLKIMN